MVQAQAAPFFRAAISERRLSNSACAGNRQSVRLWLLNPQLACMHAAAARAEDLRKVLRALATHPCKSCIGHMKAYMPATRDTLHSLQIARTP